jgi:hypothetical protein
MDNDIVKLQSTLFESIVGKVMYKINVVDGVITDTAENYKLLTQLDKTFNNFESLMFEKLLPSISNGVDKLSTINSKYFETLLAGDLPSKFANIVEKTNVINALRIGLTGEKMVRGGMVMNLIRQSGNMDSVKQMMQRAISSNMNISDFTENLKTELLGDKTTKGKLERQFHSFTYDLYQQYDAAYNAKLAEELDLKYFIYQGGLVEDSRDFCREHNGHVYTTKEAEDWKTWTPSQSVNITDYDQKDPNSVPGYMDYEGYDPLVDRGGYNCRHTLAYISEGLALKLRTDLEKPEEIDVEKK